MKSYNQLQNSQTLMNLARAFSLESQTRNRYLFYAKTAGRSNLKVLEEIFLETADDERGHGEIFYDYITSGVSDVIEESTNLVRAVLGTMADNLASAARGEYMEWAELFPAFGKVAEKEGFATISKSFYAIASVEKMHDLRFRNYLERLNTGRLFIMDYPVEWKCLNCGYQHYGTMAPDTCPACLHPRDFFIFACDDITPLGTSIEDEEE